MRSLLELGLVACSFVSWAMNRGTKSDGLQHFTLPFCVEFISLMLMGSDEHQPLRVRGISDLRQRCTDALLARKIYMLRFGHKNHPQLQLQLPDQVGVRVILHLGPLDHDTT